MRWFGELEDCRGLGWWVCYVIVGAGVLWLWFWLVYGMFAVGFESGSCVAEFCEAINLSAVRVRERSVNFIGFRCGVSL